MTYIWTTELLRILVAVLAITLWQIAWFFLPWDERLLPPPSQILGTLAEDCVSGILWADLSASLQRIGLGYFAGASIGILIGILTGTQRWADLVIGSLFQLIRPIPPIAMVPLVVVWFGIGEFGKVFLIGIGALFPVWINTHLGVSAINSTYLYLVQSLHVGYWNRLWNIWLPGAAGSIVAGLRTSVALAFYCLIAAEMTGALYGLAYRIEIAHLAFRVDRMIGHMLVLGILSFLADVLTRYALAKAFPWTA